MRTKGYWNKYNPKSLKILKGKWGSEYYQHLFKIYGEKKADALYKVFKYQSSHGQKTITNIIN